MLLSSVMKLAQIYLLAPMSAASAERSFSVQRRIKHYSRTEKRYNNLMMLNIHKERTDAIDLIKIARDFAQRSDTGDRPFLESFKLNSKLDRIMLLSY